MKLILLLIATVLFSFLAKAQNLTEENLIGDWNVVKVDLSGSEDIEKKNNFKMYKDYLLNTTLNFSEDRFFYIETESFPDEEIIEMMLLNYKQWVVQNGEIILGKDSDRSAPIRIKYKKSNGKTYFMLPMARLEVEKVSNDQDSKPKNVESTPKTFVDPLPMRASEERSENKTVDFHSLENPPLARDCKSHWELPKRKDCTSSFIQEHVAKEFNRDLASDLELIGRVRIMIEFVIDTNGKVIDVSAKGEYRALDQHAIEIIEALPDFAPATMDGKPVKVSYRLPLTFVVENLKK